MSRLAVASVLRVMFLVKQEQSDRLTDAHCHEQMTLLSKPFLLEVLFPLYLRYNKQVYRIYWI